MQKGDESRDKPRGEYSSLMGLAEGIVLLVEDLCSLRGKCGKQVDEETSLLSTRVVMELARIVKTWDIEVTELSNGRAYFADLWSDRNAPLNTVVVVYKRHALPARCGIPVLYSIGSEKPSLADDNIEALIQTKLFEYGEALSKQIAA